MSFQDGNAPVERSLPDNKNSVTTERTLIMEETIVGMCRMKEYARKYGGAHSVPITGDMIMGIKEAKRKDCNENITLFVYICASPCH